MLLREPRLWGIWWVPQLFSPPVQQARHLDEALGPGQHLQKLFCGLPNHFVRPLH